MILEVSMHAVQDVQIGTSGDKVWTQLPQKFFNLDFDNEEHAEDEEIWRLTKELSILRIEVRKWRSQVERCQEGMVSLAQQKENQGIKGNMGRRTHVPENSLGRDTEGAKKVQIRAGGKRSVV